MSAKNIDIETLSLDQRLQLIEELWDSLEDKGSAISLSPLQQKELDSRLDRIDAGDDAGIPWDEMMSHIRARLG